MSVSGPALGITGGHCDNNLLPSEFRYKSDGVADGPWAARAKVVAKLSNMAPMSSKSGLRRRSQQRRSAGTPQFTLEEMQLSPRKAHKLGRKVAAHAHGTHPSKTPSAPASIPSSIQPHG